MVSIIQGCGYGWSIHLYLCIFANIWQIYLDWNRGRMSKDGSKYKQKKDRGREKVKESIKKIYLKLLYS